MTEIYDSGTKLTEQSIAEFEERQGVKIPADYRLFLLQNNGGRPRQTDFILSKNSKADQVEWGSITRFLGIDVQPTNSLDYVLRIFQNRLPHDLFPIARDPGGNLICMSNSKSKGRKIYFWDHEYEANEGEIPDFKNISLLANNLDEFLNNLAD